MADVVVSAKIGNEFVLRFGGEHHRINAETLTNSLLEITSVLKEINRIINSETEMKIYIKAIEAGSFKIGIEIIGKDIKEWLVLGLFALALSSIPQNNGGIDINFNFNINVNVGDVFEVNIPGNEQSQREDQTFEFSKDERKCVEEVSNSKICYRSSRNLLKCLGSDEEVKSIELTEKSGNYAPLAVISRQDFILPDAAENNRGVTKIQNERKNNMNKQFMTVAQTIEELEMYPEVMKVKITRLNDIVHGIFQFNTIRISDDERELQIAYDNNKTLYQKDEHDLGVLLHQIKNLVKDKKNQAEVEEYLVCTREIGSINPNQVIKETMYLKHIKQKKEFASGSSMVNYDGVDDTIYFEFMK